jgi:hypothetical protein
MTYRGPTPRHKASVARPQGNSQGNMKTNGIGREQYVAEYRPDNDLGEGGPKHREKQIKAAWQKK